MDVEAIRVSVDTKATMNVGDYSRGGKSRGQAAVEALDHDMLPKEKLTPVGILELGSGRPFLAFTESCKTSDFIADGLTLWWNSRKVEFEGVKRLTINLDNGPECSAHRSQFLQRMTEFADATGLDIHLAYYPPYHSKYNPIEHYWGGLERSWNGYLLDSVDTIVRRATNFAWRGVKTMATLVAGIYEKGVKLTYKEKKVLETRLIRSETLPWWDVIIKSKTVNQ